MEKVKRRRVPEAFGDRQVNLPVEDQKAGNGGGEFSSVRTSLSVKDLSAPRLLKFVLQTR